MDKAFCILAAGRGSRLEELTTSMNKALLPISGKAAVSHIIDKVPKDCQIVVAVGYDKEKVVEYCQAAHPDRDFVFVGVDKLEGAGSGPGYSLLCCRDHLKKPFYLCNVDTLVRDDRYPSLSNNWIGVDYTTDSNAFATVDYTVQDGRVKKVFDKGERDLEAERTTFYQTSPYRSAYIGLMGIKEWESFWCLMDEVYQRHLSRDEFQYVEVLKRIDDLSIRSLGWLDIGTVENYRKTLKWFAMFSAPILGMEKNITELTYKVGRRLVKVCWESAKNQKRIARAYKLSPHTPPLVFTGKYVTAYEWMEGETLYHCNDLGIWTNFLNWCNSNLWCPTVLVKNKEAWESVCHSFYFDKTWERVRMYQEIKGWDKCPSLFINGYYCESVESYLTCLSPITWDMLRRGWAANIHGDLQFDNVVLTSQGDFKLIDWRECFGDQVDYGDLNYDLAKIYSGIDLPYHTFKTRRVDLTWDCGVATYDLQISSTLSSFRFVYEDWLRERAYDVVKIKLLSALIHLNMAPLHPAPIGDVLYLHANLRLAQLHKQGVI